VAATVPTATHHVVVTLAATTDLSGSVVVCSQGVPPQATLFKACVVVSSTAEKVCCCAYAGQYHTTPNNCQCQPLKALYLTPQHHRPLLFILTSLLTSPPQDQTTATAAAPAGDAAVFLPGDLPGVGPTISPQDQGVRGTPVAPSDISGDTASDNLSSATGRLNLQDSMAGEVPVYHLSSTGSLLPTTPATNTVAPRGSAAASGGQLLQDSVRAPVTATPAAAASKFTPGSSTASTLTPGTTTTSTTRVTPTITSTSSAAREEARARLAAVTEAAKARVTSVQPVTGVVGSSSTTRIGGGWTTGTGEVALGG
jgi:hypothetical protein